MTTSNRVNPFEDLSDKLSEGVSDFAPKSKAQSAKPIEKDQIDKIAQENNFPSRQPEKPAKPQIAALSRARRRFTTGRNQQINIKATSETIDRLYRIADQKHMPLGEILQRALDALETSERRVG